MKYNYQLCLDDLFSDKNQVWPTSIGTGCCSSTQRWQLGSAFLRCKFHFTHHPLQPISNTKPSVTCSSNNRWQQLLEDSLEQQLVRQLSLPDDNYRSSLSEEKVEWMFTNCFR